MAAREPVALTVRRGRRTAADAPVLVLAHGAGAGSSHPWMVAYAEALAARGLVVVTFDFDYVLEGKKAPDRAPALEARYRAVVASVRKKHPRRPLFLGGKSMGGRIASHLAAAGDACEGLVFFGYPLHPPNRPEKRRDAHLASIRVPMLFVQGERDPFGTKAEMTPLVKKLRSTLFVVPRGDHSLAVPKRDASADDVRERVVEAVAKFVGLSPARS